MNYAHCLRQERRKHARHSAASPGKDEEKILADFEITAGASGVTADSKYYIHKQAHDAWRETQSIDGSVPQHRGAAL